MEDTFKEKMEWQLNVPIFKNPVILKQLGIAIGIPFGILALVIGFASGKSVYTIYGLGLIAALLFFTWLFIMLVYKGKYELEFVIDDKGVTSRTQVKQAKKNRIINAVTVLLGFLSGKLTAVGAGMLAQSRQEVFLRWDRITKVKYKPKSRVILLRAGWTEQIALFCLEENYQQIKDRVIFFSTCE